MTSRRRGVASIVGTLVFLLVFMVALAAQAYMSGTQAQTAQSEYQAEQNAALRGRESLLYTGSGTGISTTDAGPGAVSINHIILRFPNGTVYDLAAQSVVPSGGGVVVSNLVPPGVCSPGAATCLSKFNQIVSGNPSGSSVWLLTSLGNTFWYAYASVPAPAAGSATRLTSDHTTSGTGVYVSTGLTLTLSSNTNYIFWVLTAVSPATGIEAYNFEVHALPAGATMTACTPLSYPINGGGNQPTNCVTSTGTPLAYTPFSFGVSPPTFSNPGLFGTVSVGATGGTLQIDIACVANCGSVSMKAGSFIFAMPVA